MAETGDDDATATLTGMGGAPDLDVYVHTFWSGGSRLVPLTGATDLVFGRGEGSSVRVDLPSVSRRHARLSSRREGITVEDLGSHNGTRLDGAPLPPGTVVPVGVGSILELGSVVAVIRRGFATRNQIPTSTGPMQRTLELADLVAKSAMSLILLGETGTGKTRLAKRIHDMSPRAAGPFVSVNFAALPENLVESELFGYQRGAFTGAEATKVGIVESAHKGTLFLDEVGEVPRATQAKLLRVLESGEVLRLGATKPTPVDVRYVSATNRDLKAAVDAGEFRADLFFRLDGLSLTVPPLRERKEELRALATQFAVEAAAEFGKAASLAEDAMARLDAHSWPGNVRELRNVVARSVLLAAGPTLHAGDVQLDGARAAAGPKTPAHGDDAAEAEKQRILRALEACAGNQSRAAAELGMSRRTLVDRLGRYGINRPRLRRP